MEKQPKIKLVSRKSNIELSSFKKISKTQAGTFSLSSSPLSVLFTVLLRVQRQERIRKKGVGNNGDRSAHELPSRWSHLVSMWTLEVYLFLLCTAQSPP